MKQILQNARSGELELADVPAPMPARGQILVQNYYSVMSPGTDKLSMSFAKMSMIAKAQARPDLAGQVFSKLREEGPLSTYQTIMARLDVPQPLGYSSAGIVRAVGPGVQEYSVGDRVACAGAGYANHAELVVVPTKLVARVPEGLPLDIAAHSTLGAIAMQGLRVAEPTIGEIVAVVGLGLVGQLTVQLLRANGCRVVALDLDEQRAEQSLKQGAEWAFTSRVPDGWIASETGGAGVDFAVVTASSETANPLTLAAEMCRKKGRISIVGALPIEIDRRVMFDKELDLRMSTSYGPGRYDPKYEESGIDYPISYVRWTENRNLQSFLALAQSGAIDPTMLDIQVRPFGEAVEAYNELSQGNAPSLAVVFEYETEVDAGRSLTLVTKPTSVPGEVGVSFIGAGNYAKSVLLPVLRGIDDVDRISLVTATGPSAKRAAKAFKFRGCSTDPQAVFKDPNVDLVYVTTRHDTHVDYAVEAFEHGKGVWLEKPASIDLEGLDRLLASAREHEAFLFVGYNRRFSKHARTTRSVMKSRTGPMKVHYRVISASPGDASWVMDPLVGGGRVIGEVCHFVDLCNYLVGELPTDVYARSIRQNSTDDSFSAMFSYPDGSVATLDFLANGASSLPKEYFEASADGKTVISDNYRRTKISSGRDVNSMNQDKGQRTAMSEVVRAYRDRQPSPLTLEEIESVSLSSFAILRSMAIQQPVAIERSAVGEERKE